MFKQLFRIFVELTNRRSTSHVLQYFAKSTNSKRIVKRFQKVYGINEEDLPKPIHEYESLHQFFTRPLREGTRKINQEEHAIISPVDGTVADAGTITSNHAFYVKGKSYSLTDLVHSETHVQKFANGKYIVLYLSPANYHRFHAPVASKKLDYRVLGNRSYPVNQLGIKYGKDVLSKNYRHVFLLEMENGSSYIYIPVGALFVNSIEITNDKDDWAKGEEVGYFSFGSTVVMLFEKNHIDFSPHIVPGHRVKMGEKIGDMI